MRKVSHILSVHIYIVSALLDKKVEVGLCIKSIYLKINTKRKILIPPKSPSHYQTWHC